MTGREIKRITWNQQDDSQEIMKTGSTITRKNDTGTIEGSLKHVEKNVASAADTQITKRRIVAEAPQKSASSVIKQDT